METESPNKKEKSFFRVKLEEIFGIDLRSLAVFRIGLGLIVLADLIIRSFDIKAFYSDEGVLPRSLLLTQYSNIWNFSVYLLNGTVQFQILLFIISAIFAVLLIIGYKTRFVTFISWILLLSLQNRNPFLFYLADGVLRMCFFWSMFLPLGAVYSVDRMLNSSQNPVPKRILSFASAGFLIQIALVYFYTAILKTGKEWHSEGSAIFYALNVDQYATPLALYLRQFPEFLKFLTHAVLNFEIIAPILLFSPIFTTFIRTVMAIGICAMIHCFGLCLTLGLFPWVCTVAMIPFLPTKICERISSIKSISKINIISQNYLSKIIEKLPHCPVFVNVSKPVNYLAGLFLIYILCWNMWSLADKYKMPDQFYWIGPVLRIDQKWDMFAPNPYKIDGWYVIPGQLFDGSEIDLFRDSAPVTFEKPKLVSKLYKNMRWCGFFMKMWDLQDMTQCLRYAKTLCIDWNNTHKGDSRLKEFQIYYMREPTVLDGTEVKPEKVLFWQHYCYCDPGIEDCKNKKYDNL